MRFVNSLALVAFAGLAFNANAVKIEATQATTGGQWMTGQQLYCGNCSFRRDDCTECDECKYQVGSRPYYCDEPQWVDFKNLRWDG